MGIEDVIELLQSRSKVIDETYPVELVPIKSCQNEDVLLTDDLLQHVKFAHVFENFFHEAGVPEKFTGADPLDHFLGAKSKNSKSCRGIKLILIDPQKICSRA